MASLSHCSRVAVLGVGMRVDLSRVSRGRGSIFLSLPSLVTQGVSLFEGLEVFWRSGCFSQNCDFCEVLYRLVATFCYFGIKVAVLNFHKLQFRSKIDP